MRYKCKYCGRVFKEKCAHKCKGVFRKRHLAWIEVDDEAANSEQPL